MYTHTLYTTVHVDIIKRYHLSMHVFVFRYEQYVEDAYVDFLKNHNKAEEVKIKYIHVH